MYSLSSTKFVVSDYFLIGFYVKLYLEVVAMLDFRSIQKTFNFKRTTKRTSRKLSFTFKLIFREVFLSIIPIKAHILSLSAVVATMDFLS